MIAKRIQRSVNQWLLRPFGKVWHCDLTSHCSLLLLGRYDWGASPLLFCTVIGCMTHRPGCYMTHMSERGSTEFMKASVSTLLVRCMSTRHNLVFAASRDPSIQTRTEKGEGGSSPTWQAREFGIVCSRQRRRKGNKQIKVERLSFGKI